MSGNEGGIWLGLLNWSLAHTDGTSPSEVRPMSDEDRLFLEKVMKEAVKDEPVSHYFIYLL